jgi:hypothetical protein
MDCAELYHNCTPWHYYVLMKAEGGVLSLVALIDKPISIVIDVAAALV